MEINSLIEARQDSNYSARCYRPWPNWSATQWWIPCAVAVDFFHPAALGMRSDRLHSTLLSNVWTFGFHRALSGGGREYRDVLNLHWERANKIGAGHVEQFAHRLNGDKQRITPYPKIGPRFPLFGGMIGPKSLRGSVG